MAGRRILPAAGLVVVAGEAGDDLAVSEDLQALIDTIQIAAP